MLIAAAFILLSVGPALPASAQSVSPQVTGLGTGAGGGFAPSSATLTGSAAIADDIADIPARVVPGGASYDRFGTTVAALGDLNGDGADDLGIVSKSPAALTIIPGARGQAGGGAPVVLRGTDVAEIIGLALAGGGDLNGDGFDDFAVTSLRPSGGGAFVQEVHVYYGEGVIARSIARATLSAPTLPSTFGVGLAVLPDVDGDGFSDLVVVASPAGSPASPGAVFLYRGSATGVPDTPSWTYAASDTTDAFGSAVFRTGDPNGDGLSDFVVTTGGDAGSDGYARVFHFLGDLSGAPAGPYTVTGEQRNDGYGAAVSGGDFNGDGFDDLLVGSPEFDPTPESADAGQLLEYRGGSRGLASAPIQKIGATGARYATSVANAGDLNGDGIDDAAVGAPLASAGGPFTNGQVFVYFGGATGLSSRYDMSEAGEAGYDLYGASIASQVDLDGDGRDDLALCAPGRDNPGAVDAGACYVYGGLRIRLPAIAVGDLVAADLTDGMAMARSDAPYHFVFTFVHRGPASALQSAEQTFLSEAMRSGAAVRYDGSAQALGLVSDPGSVVAAASLASLMPDSSYSPGTTWVHSFQIYASVRFAWALSDPEPLDVRLTVRDKAGGESTTTVPDVFFVVSALEFRSAPEVRRPDASLLAPGDFARAGELLTWTGGALAYQGTAVAPPSAEVSLFLVDSAGGFVRASYDPATGDAFAQKAAMASDNPADVHRLEARVQGGAVLATAARGVPTDALTPGFGSSTPGDNEVVTQATYPVSIKVFDSGSGVDGARVEFALSHSNPPVFSDWHAAAAGTGPQVVAQATVGLAENSYNFVQFRAFDRVGNGPSLSPPIQLQLDYGAVDFALVSPSETTWVRDTTPTVTFSIHKDHEPAVDLATIEVQVNGASGGSWRPLGLAGSSLDARFAAEVALAEGDQNDVRVRTRLAGHDTVYVSPPFRVMVDTLLPSIDLVGPEAGSWATDGYAVSVVRVRDASSGPARTTVHYRYLLPGMSEWSAWAAPQVEAVEGGFLARATIAVHDGLENFVVWQAHDAAGNGPSTSAYQRLVADSRPVSFAEAVPRDGARLESVSRLSILVEDGDGSGVDLSSVEYEVVLPSGESAGWQDAGRSGVSTRGTVSVAYVLPEGTSTVRWRAHDAAGTALTVSEPTQVTVEPPAAVDNPPALVLTAPVSLSHFKAGTDVRFDAGRSVDPEGRPLFFQWSIDGQPQRTHQSAFWLQLAPGQHTVTLVVSDGTHSPDITVAFTVDPPAAPPGVFSSGLGQAMLVSLALLVVASVGARVWASRARRALSFRPTD